MIGVRVVQDLNEDMLHTAGAADGPVLPAQQDYDLKCSRITRGIEDKIIELVDAHDFMCSYEYSFTSEYLLGHLVSKKFPTSIILQKPGKMINAHLTGLYSQLGMPVDRAHFPGIRMKHLFPRPHVTDHGQIDGVRLIGNTPMGRKRKDEDRPLLHPKVFVFGKINAKGVPVGAVTIGGSWNATDNSNKSINEMYLFHSKKFAKDSLEQWAHHYSWSEGLWNMRPGLYSEFLYMKKKIIKPAKSVRCSKCGQTNMVYSPIGHNLYGLRCWTDKCKNTQTLPA